MTILTVLLLAVATCPVESHEKANPVYRDLLENGVPAGPAGGKVAVPPPAIPDGLDPAAQKKALAGIADEAHPLELLLEQSVVAPFVLKISDLKPANAAAPARGVEAWFILYGDLDAMAKKEIRQKLLDVGQGQAKVQELTAADLEKIGIKSDKPTACKEEFYNHADVTLFDRVKLSDTHHLVMTRTAESIVVASTLDPRFNKGTPFPSQWESIPARPGQPKPYEGVGRYVKITKLAEPQGALLVEYHMVFPEPTDWFDGANFLRSKLPMLVQQEVRGIRKDLARSKQ